MTALARIDPAEPAGVASTHGVLAYAIGDIHGCYDLLAAMLRRVRDDARRHAAGRRAVLVLLGDYVDRGPDSARVLTAIARLSRHGEYELHVLLGNHDACFLDFIDQPEAGAEWLDFGGRETLASYGVEPPLSGEEAFGRIRARDDLLERMPIAHLSLLRRCELMVEIGDYAFVHAGIRPGTALARQGRDDLLWIRGGFLDAAGPFEKRIVHGHSWTGPDPTVRPERIGLDTGAYETGVLTALRLDGTEVEVIQVR